jgi:tetratricopeptide (TPR) repeat protein
MTRSTDVRVWTEDIVFPTYLPQAPDPNPMFLERRVYQGSSGKVYPLPFIDRIAETKTGRAWKGVWIENEFLRVLILPEIGGRIHAAQDKTNGYDFIYRQTVIKPALVGLAGPWISGGIEINWPQHHRPSTFRPVDFEFEESADGSKTVWLSEHDPLQRMKGMHGVCLHPGRAVFELKARVYNRTPFVQTFLWWTNLGIAVHQGYQSFFPPDVRFVADHAKRAVSRYPLAQGVYYGVDYGQRGREGIPPTERSSQDVGLSQIANRKSKITNPQPNDLSWYVNIPVPTSYMALGSREDFFGGYDHVRQAGFIHVADRHIAPGKKQWTWGNHDFGYAWDRNLTDADGPYIELMAGVYSDNQPDFSFLEPGETKSWSQYLYPIQKIGPAQRANRDAAVSLEFSPRRLRVGVSVSSPFPRARIRLEHRSGRAFEWKADLKPGAPFVVERARLTSKWSTSGVTLRVQTEAGRDLISYTVKPSRDGPLPPPATEPAWPGEMASADELYLTGLHLDQYRHATRSSALYWREALRRDPFDARCNRALGLWHLRRGEWREAENHIRRAIERLTGRNPNPRDGEPFYSLGLCLRYQLDFEPRPDDSARDSLDPSRFEAAYEAFSKACWNESWQAAGYLALAELDCRRTDWERALDHLDRALRVQADNLRTRDLKALVLRKVDRSAEAKALLTETRTLDPLDWWARHLLGEPLRCDTQTRLDLALDLARAGFHAEALDLLGGAVPEPESGAAPLLEYYRGWLAEKLGQNKSARVHYARATRQPPDYCFPARLEEIAILEAALRANPRDARAHYYLGNLLYDKQRHREAIRHWEASARLDRWFSVVWRNLGIAYFNVARNPARAYAAYEKAFRARPEDARLLYERDQLWKRMGRAPLVRLRELETHLDLVDQRDDLSLELCALYNQTGCSVKALHRLSARAFQPWEGGEGLALGQHVRTHLALGKAALARGEPAYARAHFRRALTTPPHLGEARHLLAKTADIHYWLGQACHALGDHQAACCHWTEAARVRGDFRKRRPGASSEWTYYSGLALRCLGRKAQARRVFRDLLEHVKALHKSKPAADYFATSLPAMLLFEDDLARRQKLTATFLQAQACLGLGRKAEGRRLLRRILKWDPSHAGAADLLRQEEIGLG